MGLAHGTKVSVRLRLVTHLRRLPTARLSQAWVLLLQTGSAVSIALHPNLLLLRLPINPYLWTLLHRLSIPTYITMFCDVQTYNGPYCVTFLG